MQAEYKSNAELKRIISLPMLIFYGVGVTVGAGIFALSGEVINISGNFAPWSFLLAAVIAGLTAVSYSIQSSESARAAGEAWYVKQAFGETASVIVGLMLVVSALFSSAAIAVAFGSYMQEITSIPGKALTALAILIITVVAWKGIKETVIFAAVITTVEVGALLVVVFVGFPQVVESENLWRSMIPTSFNSEFSFILSGSVVAFFAFIGFEDIVNMGEETVNANRNLPIAIMATLFITVVLYILISIVCIAIPNRELLLESGAPLAFVFESSTGFNPWVISLCAAIAMINGILVQIVMSSRVLYGLANAGSLPKILKRINRRTQTPSVAIFLVSLIALVLSLAVSLINLAIYSSIVLMLVFFFVNLSLWYRGTKNEAGIFKRWSFFGLLSATACLLILIWHLYITLI